MIAFDRAIERTDSGQSFERRLAECFVVVVVPLHMLLPTLGGWLMVLAALRGLVLVARLPAFDRMDRHYLVACALIPAAYLLNMAFTGWDPSWLHRPAHLLITGGLVFLWIGRVGLSERALFYAAVLGSFTTLAITLFEVLVNGNARVFGWRNQWNAVPFGNFSLLLGSIAFAGSIAAMFSPERNRARVAIGLAAAIGGICASILTGTRGGWLAIPVLFAVTLWAVSRAFRARALASMHFLPAFTVMLAFVAGALLLSENAQHRIDLAVDQVGAFLGDARDEGAIDDSIDDSIEIRLEMWKWGLEQAAENPLTGIGLAQYNEARRLAVESGRMPQAFLGLANLHNELITSLALGGVPTALAVVGFWLWMGWFFVRRIGKEEAFFFSLSGLLVVAGTCVFSMTEGLFGTSAGTKAFALLLAIPAGALRYRAALHGTRRTTAIDVDA